MAQVAFDASDRIDRQLREDVVRSLTPARPDFVVSIRHDGMNGRWSIRVAGPSRVVAGAVPAEADASQFVSHIWKLFDSMDGA